MKTQIATAKAPGAIGPYSQAIDTGSMVFVSGQIPVNPATGEMMDIAATSVATFKPGKRLKDAVGGEDK